MTEERRYGEEEVSEIFEDAAGARPSSGSAHPPSVRGLTLAELPEIGTEVGVAPDRIADAAAKVDRRRSATPAPTWLGMPVSAGRTVDLPRAPTDREWEMLMGELRHTFRARGTDRSRVGIREWQSARVHRADGIRIPSAARERDQPMEYLAGRATALIAADPEK